MGCRHGDFLRQWHGRRTVLDLSKRPRKADAHLLGAVFDSQIADADHSRGHNQRYNHRSTGVSNIARKRLLDRDLQRAAVKGDFSLSGDLGEGVDFSVGEQ